MAVYKLDEANLGPYRYRYEVNGSVNGEKVLYGASKILDGAERIAKRHAFEIFDNPWETTNNKLRILANISIIDEETGKDVTTPEIEDYIDSLMSELDSRPKSRKS